MTYIWDFIASACIAAMAGLGIGGGGLVDYLSDFIKHMPQLPAQGINLLFFLFASGSSFGDSFQAKRVDLKLLLILAPLGVIGAITEVMQQNLFLPGLSAGFRWVLIVSWYH